MKITFITNYRTLAEEVYMKTISLKEMQAFVGGYIETIKLPEDKVMIVNEVGLLKRLKSNMQASIMAERRIVGNVIVMSENDFKSI